MSAPPLPMRASSASKLSIGAAAAPGLAALDVVENVVVAAAGMLRLLLPFTAATWVLVSFVGSH